MNYYLFITILVLPISIFLNIFLLIAILIFTKTKILSFNEINTIKKIFQNIPTGIILLDNEKTIKQFNESALVMFNIQENEFPELKIYHIIPEYKEDISNYELDYKMHRKYLQLTQNDIIKKNLKIGKIIFLKDITNEKILNEFWHRYEFIVDTTREMMALVRSDYTYALVNKSFCHFFNKTKNEIFNKYIYDCWGNHIFENHLQKHIDKCFQGEEIHQSDWFDIGESNKKYLNNSFYPYYDYTGLIRYCIIVTVDFTEAKLGEEIIKQSHISLELQVNEKTKELKKTIDTLKQTNLLLKNQIIKRKKTEKEIIKANNEINQLFQSIHSILIHISPDGKIINYNPIAEKILNIDKKEIIGKKLTDLKFNWDLAEINKGLSKCMIEKNFIELKDFKLYNDNKKDNILRLYINPILDDNHAILGFILWGTDITERKSLEEQLSRSQKLESIGQLAAGIAHEINTPTQYIGDNIYFLKESFSQINKILEELNILLNKAKKYNPKNRLIHTIIDHEKKIDIDYLINEIPKAIDQSIEGINRVSIIVKSIRAFSHPALEEKNYSDINKSLESTIIISKNEWKYTADLITKFDKELPQIPCYAGELNQVFLNLIINAAHAIEDKIGKNPEKKGKIIIETINKENDVIIKISDTGSGIPKNIQKKIFDPFFTTKEVGKGTGQGLAISHSVIVEKHNGKILYETEENKGTTFIIQLPK